MARIWAVARNTLAQALRMKIAAIFIVLLLILLPLMAAVMTGDGTLKGKLQTFTSYGLSLTSLLLCLLTIIIATYTLTSDIKYRQIWTVLTKPLRRHELLLGKLLGILILDAVLLSAFAAVIYGLTSVMPYLIKAPDEERMQANNEFFTARAVIKPLHPDVRQDVEQAFERLKEAGQLPDNMSPVAVRQQLFQQKLLERQAVQVGGDMIWQFNDIAVADPNQYLFVRFKYDVSVNPPDLCVYGRWIIGDDRQFTTGTENPKTPVYVVDRKDSIRTVHELAVPAKCVVDGYLGIVFQNVTLNDTVVIFPLEDGMEVLYRADTFAANYVRAVLMIFIKLAFLALLGLSVSTWLSFPVAILLAMVVFAMASVSGFISESFGGLESAAISSIYAMILQPFLNLLPQFDAASPVNYIVKGELIRWSLLAYLTAMIVCVKGLIVWIVGMIVFRCKEIAKITV